MKENWFEWYCKQIEKNKEWAIFRDKFLCPCCYMPTLSERGGFEICPICFWEDDGQDNDDAEVVRGGPNSDYSLKEARDNFVKYMTMYRANDTHNFDRENKRMYEIAELYNAHKKAVSSSSEEDWIKAQNLMKKHYKNYEKNE